jgi:hypothetical protein
MLSFLLLLLSSLQQNWREGQNTFCLEARGCREDGGGGGQGEEMAQTMYAHMNKLINKPKEKKNFNVKKKKLYLKRVLREG